MIMSQKLRFCQLRRRCSQGGGVIFMLACLMVGSPVMASVIFNEIHYHPTPPTDREIGLGFVDDDEFEFIELLNTSATPVVLTGWQIAGGVSFVFPSGTVIGAGELLVIAKDEDALLVRYPESSPAGDFDGKLANEGETVQLLDFSLNVVDEISWAPDDPWPNLANGQGSSLVRIRPGQPANEPYSWSASRIYDGSPGLPNNPMPGPIVINEILSHTDAPLEDAVELKNISSNSVDVAGWALSDSMLDPKKFIIPSPAVIPPGGYLVLYQQQFDAPANPRIPFSFNSYQGDSVFLHQTDSNGQLLRRSDDVQFPATANGISFGRSPDGTGDFMNMSGLSFGTSVTRFDSPLAIHLFRQGKGAANTAPLLGPVIIQAFNPAPADLLPEFVQLKNISLDSVPLFDPSHPDNSWGLEGGISFELPGNISLVPGESIIISEAIPDIARAAYQIPETIRIFGPWTGKLNNGGENLRLYRPDPPQTSPPDIGFVPRVEVDFIQYDPNGGWPGTVFSEGHILTRKSPVSPAQYPDSWKAETNTGFQEPQPAIQLEIVRVDDTSLEIRYSLNEVGTYNIQSSTDLESWLSGDPVQGPTTGTIDLSPANDPSGSRFFRIMKSP